MASLGAYAIWEHEVPMRFFEGFATLSGTDALHTNCHERTRREACVKTIFVTGAEGFSGGHLVQHLRRRGYEVVAGVRNRARKLAYERKYGRAQVCDVSDAINVARAIASATPDAVIHLAGLSRPGEASTEPLAAYQSIVTAWANVLDAVRRVVPRAKVVLVSACEVYGNTGSVEHPSVETTPPDPISTFGSLKAAAESIAHTFFHNYHLNVTIARPFHFTGAGQPDSFFFGAVAKRLAEWDPAAGNTLSLPDLDCQRDVLHVQDVVEAYERLIEDGRPNEVYNIASGKATTVWKIVESMIAASGKQITLQQMRTDNDRQIGVLCGDPAKIATELGWKPSRTLDQALTDLVRGYQAHEAVHTH